MSQPTTTRLWSCDTFVVRPQARSLGRTIFGKNSDRPARECQPLRRHDARSGGGRLRLAYIDIDDVPETLPHLGSSPYWCWGHEMGMNTDGVTIGNEALFTRDLRSAATQARAGQTVEPGILGMELLRLGLERATTAEVAVEVMTELLERHGQWGAGTVSTDRASAAYDNTYLIADAHDAWVLETVGRNWAARRITEPSWSLSNEPTIRTHWDRASSDLPERLSEWTTTYPPDFAEAVADPAVPLQVSHIRLQRSRQLLTDALDSSPDVGFAEAHRVLADHYEDTFLQGPKFNPARPDFHTLCMHEHPAGFTWGNTAASMIAVLDPDSPPMLWWAAATPCTSLYLPVSPSSRRLPEALGNAGPAKDTGPNPEQAGPDSYSAASYWWQFQRLLEEVSGDPLGSTYAERQPVVRSRFDEVQQGFFREAAEVQTHGFSAADWDALTDRCAKEALAATSELLDGFDAR